MKSKISFRLLLIITEKWQKCCCLICEKRLSVFFEWFNTLGSQYLLILINKYILLIPILSTMVKIQGFLRYVFPFHLKIKGKTLSTFLFYDFLIDKSLKAQVLES